MRGADGIVNAFVQRLIEAIVQARVEINPPFALMRRFLRNEHDLGPQQARIANQVTPRLDEEVRPAGSEFAGLCRFNRLGVLR